MLGKRLEQVVGHRPEARHLSEHRVLKRRVKKGERFGAPVHPGGSMPQASYPPELLQLSGPLVSSTSPVKGPQGVGTTYEHPCAGW